MFNTTAMTTAHMLANQTTSSRHLYRTRVAKHLTSIPVRCTDSESECDESATGSFTIKRGMADVRSKPILASTALTS
jgi:hypothetical protein